MLDSFLVTFLVAVADATDAVASDPWLTGDQVRLLIIAIITAVGVGLLSSVRVIIEVVGFFRGDPPAWKLYATKKELQAVENRLSTEIRELKKDQDDHLAGIYREMKDFNKSQGRIEGWIEAQIKKT